MIVIIPELDKQSHMISVDRNRDPDSNYGGKYKDPRGSETKSMVCDS